MAKKAKKRGVKPGTKRGPYKKETANNFTTKPILTLCGDLDNAILNLETRISNAIAKINSLM